MMKRFLPPVLVVLALVISGCSNGGSSGSTATTKVEQLRGYQPRPVRSVGGLQLNDFSTAPSGLPFDFVAQPGELLFVYFGYLTCPDICPTTMTDTSAGLASLDPALADRVEVAFVTVDIERDSGAEITEYMGHFFPSTQTHSLVAVDEHQLSGVSYKFGANWNVESHEPGATYGVAHSGGMYAVDDAGSIVWEWPFGTNAEELVALTESVFASTYPGG
jgi:protein SCO1/2